MELARRVVGFGLSIAGSSRAQSGCKLPWELDMPLGEGHTCSWPGPAPLERGYYCHCPWVKESLRDDTVRVPPVFCNCSAGFHKKPYEVIFGRTLRAEVLECVLAGDPWCKFAIYLPEGAYECQPHVRVFRHAQSPIFPAIGCLSHARSISYEGSNSRGASRIDRLVRTDPPPHSATGTAAGTTVSSAAPSAP